MACFIVPAVEAVVTTIAMKVLEKREDQAGVTSQPGVLRTSQKLKPLNGLLWGGSGLLAFEHLWHGEITPWFPFLTGAADPASRMEMLQEMVMVGSTMAVAVTAVWGIGMAIWTRHLHQQTAAKTARQEEWV